MHHRILLASNLLLLGCFLSPTEGFVPSSFTLLRRPTYIAQTTPSIIRRKLYFGNKEPSSFHLAKSLIDSHDGKQSRFRYTLSRLTKSWGPSRSKLSGTTTPSITDEESSPNSKTTNSLDRVLSRLTSAFPFFVLGSAILGLCKPSTLMWTNRGTLISWMLASVMCATGLTLEKEDFTKVLGQDLAAVPAGVLCQFLIMPLTAFLVGRKLLLNSGSYGASLFLGLCLVGCSPGGTASNLVSLIAKADVALSVLLTSCSTILASIVTPLLVKLLVGSTIEVSGWALCEATARVVLFPVMFGMFVNSKAPTLASRVSRFTPFASVVLVSLICGGVVAQNASMFLASQALIPLIVGSVLSLHCVGFLVGYLVPKFGLRFSERTSRTISIETGMQNSALAVVLARSIGAPAVASLPGALSATAHSCLGSILAGYWHGRQGLDQQNQEEKEVSSFTDEPKSEKLELDAGPLMVQTDVEETGEPHATAAVIVAGDKAVGSLIIKTEIQETEGPGISAAVMVSGDNEETVTVLEQAALEETIVEMEVENTVESEEKNDNPVEQKLNEVYAKFSDPNITSSVIPDNVEASVDEQVSQTDKLLQQVKDSGLAGVISYATWELAFWAVSIPVCLFGYYEVTGHMPDLSNQEDLAKLGAEAFAFVNFARFAVPLRIGLALGTTPWIQENIVDKFLTDDGEKDEDTTS